MSGRHVKNVAQITYADTIDH